MAERSPGDAETVAHRRPEQRSCSDLARPAVEPDGQTRLELPGDAKTIVRRPGRFGWHRHRRPDRRSGGHGAVVETGAHSDEHPANRSRYGIRPATTRRNRTSLPQE